MKKINKIICCLILPFVAIACLSGCGGNRPSADILNKYSSIKDAYKSSGIFGSVDSDITGDAINITHSATGEIGKLQSFDMRSYDLSVIDKLKADENLQVRYLMLINVQYRLLNRVFEYYEGMSENFFANTDILDVDKKEMKTLYNKLEDLEDAIATFKVAKTKFEQAVEVMTFGGVVRADVTSYAYSVNLLIEQSFDFAGYFKGLNTKYMYSGEITEENKLSYVRHYFYEADYDLAEIMYYRYLKSCNNINECDLCYLASGIGDNTHSNYEPYNFLRDVIISKDSPYDYLYNPTFYDSLINGEKVITIEQLEDFNIAKEGFLQKTEIYKIVYDNMDYYSYNSHLLNNDVKSYKKSVSKVEQSNIQLMEEYYKNSFLGFYNTELKNLYEILK